MRTTRKIAIGLASVALSTTGIAAVSAAPASAALGDNIQLICPTGSGGTTYFLAQQVKVKGWMWQVVTPGPNINRDFNIVDNTARGALECSYADGSVNPPVSLNIPVFIDLKGPKPLEEG